MPIHAVRMRISSTPPPRVTGTGERCPDHEQSGQSFRFTLLSEKAIPTAFSPVIATLENRPVPCIKT